MENLIKGILQFRKRKLPELVPLFQKLADGQRPSSLCFACSDSRVDPALITSSLPGDLFVHRSVGNLIPPARPDGISVGDVSEASSIEFAVEVLQVRDVVIIGHSSCGAMSAALQGFPHPELAPNLLAWLKLTEPAHRMVKELNFSPSLSAVDRLSQANVLVQLEHAASYPAIQKRLKEGTLLLHGAWFDVATGDVHYYDADASSFEILDEKRGASLMSKMLKP